MYDLAYRLAWLAKSRCKPNPAVSALLIWRGHVLATGVTGIPGDPHAEANLFATLRLKHAFYKNGNRKMSGKETSQKDAGIEVEGKRISLSKAIDTGWLELLQHHDKFPSLRAICMQSQLILTLSPCTFQGRTPACLPLLLESGIREVHLAHDDPHSKVFAKSIASLKKANIAVFDSFPLAIKEKLFYLNFDYFLKQTACDGNADFFCITHKVATTLDGKMATGSGHSKWITNDKARGQARFQRLHHDCVLVGAGTLLADNPRLDGHHLNAFSVECECCGIESTQWQLPQPVILFLRDSSIAEINILKQTRLFLKASSDADCNQKKNGTTKNGTTNQALSEQSEQDFTKAKPPLFVYSASFSRLNAALKHLPLQSRLIYKNQLLQRETPKETEAHPAASKLIDSSHHLQAYDAIFSEVFTELSRRGLQTVYCEGGATLSGKLLRRGYGHRFSHYIAPKYLADDSTRVAFSALGLPQAQSIADALQLQFCFLEMIEDKSLEKNDTKDLHIAGIFATKESQKLRSKTMTG